MNDHDIIVDKAILDITATLECGQLFRYDNCGTHYHLWSGDEECILHYRGGSTVIESNNSDYFHNYFDLSRDYNSIKSQLQPLPYMAEAIGYGDGIRIVNQCPLETIISFIISANNNIPRIKKIINMICNNSAFPTISELANYTINDFSTMGAGYRARYLHTTIKYLVENNSDFITWSSLSTNDLLTRLIKLCGVGSKVADCIALFGYHKPDVFPVDTWIMQVYNSCFDSISTAKEMRYKLIATYGDLSGYAQQYLFYAAREGLAFVDKTTPIKL